MKILSRKMVAILLMLSMIFSTSGISTFAESLDDMIETETTIEEGTQKETHFEAEEESEIVESDEDPSLDISVEEETTEVSFDAEDEEEETDEQEETDQSETETEVVAESETVSDEIETSEALDETKESEQDSTEENVEETVESSEQETTVEQVDEIATVSEAAEVVEEETTVAVEDVVATDSEATEVVVEEPSIVVATNSEAFILKVENIVSKHDETWQPLSQESSKSLILDKFTKYYLTEDFIVFKNVYGFMARGDQDEEYQHITICLHGHNIDFESRVDFAEVAKYFTFVDCGGEIVEDDVAVHDEYSWKPLGQTGFENITSAPFPTGKYYLTEDVIVKGYYMEYILGSQTTICLHGFNLTFEEGFQITQLTKPITITNCSREKCNFNSVANFSVYSEDISSTVTFENLNIVSDKKLLIRYPMIFDNCTFDIQTTEEDNAAIEISSKQATTFKNLDYNNNSKGFLIDGGIVNFENVNMKNNTADILFVVQNSSVVNVMGNGVYEGNKNIYELHNSKLNVIDGSGSAKDTFRQPSSLEYHEAVITKKDTKLLDPDKPGINIVYKKNVGNYIIKSYNSETVFDGVIAKNEFVGYETLIGAYIAAGEDKSKLTLINRAYVNQNRRNILVNDNSEIYGSITYEDGTFDTLDRDATLSFYPVRSDITILRDVIRKNENSLILTARNLKSDDEWTTEIGDYLYKACMIDGYTNDLFEYDENVENHPAVGSWVLCDITDREDGLQQGTFKLGLKDYKVVTLRLHLGEGVLTSTSFNTINETNAKYPYDEFGNVIEVYWRPFYKQNGYQENFVSRFNAMGIKWIDKTIEDAPYEYQHKGWSLSPEWTVSATGKQAPRYLDEGIKDIVENKWEKYHYKDEVDLYACWGGKLKQKLTFKVQDEKREATHPIAIDYFENKSIYARVDFPITLPVYESPKDFLYDGFELKGWRELDKFASQDLAGGSVTVYRGGVMEMGSEYTPAHHTDFHDGEEVFFHPEFRGAPHDIHWYLGSEGIVSVSEMLQKKMDSNGFYVEADKQLGEPYSILKPTIDDALTSIHMTLFELEDDIEFVGWTKQEIKAPLASASQLDDIVLVRDYVRGFSSREDAYYYPVMLRATTKAQHDGYLVLTSGVVNDDETLPGGTYHLNNDTELLYPKEISGNVVIDLHGQTLTIRPGAFFYTNSEYDMTFTDCMYDSRVGGIYNKNGVVYDGRGALTFNKVKLAGSQTYTFQDLEKEIIMDDVDIIQIGWVGALHSLNGDEDFYPRNITLENSRLHIKNSTIQKTTGQIHAINGSHLTLTNVKYLKNGGTDSEGTIYGGLFRVINESKMTINSPCWFEGNKDLFLVNTSSLEINSNADHFDGTNLDEIKDNAVIFKNNGTQTLGYLFSADVKMSGIYVDNKVRLGIFDGDDQGDASTKSRPTTLHYDGYSYVRGNHRGAGQTSGWGDMTIRGTDIVFRQNDSDRINVNSVIDIWTWWNTPLYFTNCEPDACRAVSIIGNLTDEEKEFFDKNRDENGNIRNFTLMGSNDGLQIGNFCAVIDGVHYDSEKKRGWDIVYNPRREQDVIDIHIKMNYDTTGHFKDMNGNIVRETVIQLDKKNPENVKQWFDNLPNLYIPYDSFGWPTERKMGKIYRDYIFGNDEKYSKAELNYDMYRSADYLNLFITEDRLEEPKEKEVYLSNTYEIFYNVNLSALQKYEGATYSINVDGGYLAKDLTNKDTHTVRDIKKDISSYNVIGGDYDRYLDMFPYTLKGWKLVNGDEEILLQPGETYNFRKDFIGKNSYWLDAVWEPRPIEVRFMTNDYVKYRGTEDGSYVIIATIGQTFKVPKVLDLDIDPNMTFFGWVDEEHHSSFTINGVKLPQDMYISKFAQEKVTLRLGSTHKFNKYLRWWNIYPLFFPKNDTVLNSIIEEQKRKQDALQARLELIGEIDIKVDNLHSDHVAKDAGFFAAENDMTESICLYEDTTFTGKLNVTGDLRICLHKKNFTINGGVFNIAENSKLTICNCEDVGSVTISNTNFVGETGKVTFEDVTVNTTVALSFNKKSVDFANVKFEDINTSGAYFVSATNGAKVNFERITFDGLAKGFLYDNAEGLFNGVSIKNSTANVLFTLNNNAKVNLKEYINFNTGEVVLSYYENNKNIALVDNSKFMVSGANKLDSQGDAILYDFYGEPTRDSYGGVVEQTKIKLLDSAENPINKNTLQRVVFKNNTGNYLFGAKNNAKIFFTGIALKNNFTATSDGKMGVYVNLGGNNTLVLRTNPYVNQNNRNIVVTSNDYITSETDELEFTSGGQSLSANATLSFYLTEKKYQRVLVGANNAMSAQVQGGDFKNHNYTVKFADGSVRKNYFFAACMIEGHRDDIFEQYGDSYAGTNMRIVYGQGRDGSDDFGFFAEPYVEKEEIAITLHANGGKFKDPNGNDVTTSYTFNYKRTLPDENIKNWFNSLVPTAVDSRDNYETNYKGWSRLSDSMKSMSKSEILEYEADVELYAYYEFPELATLNFYAEKGNKNKLKGQAYNNFEPKTVYVRFTEGYYGNITTPDIDVTPINGYKISGKWETDDSSYNRYLEPGTSTNYQKSNERTVFNYYLNWIEPEVNVTINAKNGVFIDPNGKQVKESYVFTFKKYTAEESTKNWLRNIAPKAVDTVDNYVVTAKKFVDSKDSTKIYTPEQLLTLGQDIEVDALYEFPKMMTLTFYAEKNNEQKMNGVAYKNFTPVSKYVRFDQENNTKASIVAPAMEVELLGEYYLGASWISDDAVSLKPSVQTLLSDISGVDTLTYYLDLKLPKVYTAVFRAEKDGATGLKGKAYDDSFSPITKTVKLSEDGYTKGILTAPERDVIKIIGNYTTDYIWRAENSAYGNVEAGKTLTVKEMSIPNDTMYFYMSFSTKSSGNTSSGGSSRGGSSSGGSSSGSSSSDSSSIGPVAPTSPTDPTSPVQQQETPQQAQQEVQQQQTEVQVQAPAEVPSNDNPFGIEMVMNEVGQVEVLSATETGKAQMEKANAVIQEALANTNREVAKVSEVSVKAEEAQWSQSADGKWTLSTNNAEPIKDTWQKVEGANGKEGWYKFDKEGKMQTGWVADGDHVFYLIESGENAGQMVRGTTINIGGVEFKFTAEGALESMVDKSALVGNTVTSNLANTNTQTANDALLNAAANNAQAAALANNAAALAAANNQTITDADIVAATLATGQTVEQIRAAYELAQAQFEASLAALAVAFNGTAAALPSAPAPVATQNAGVAVAGVNDFNSGVPIVPILP